jgi:hypothetical protein
MYYYVVTNADFVCLVSNEFECNLTINRFAERTTLPGRTESFRYRSVLYAMQNGSITVNHELSSI